MNSPGFYLNILFSGHGSKRGEICLSPNPNDWISFKEIMDIVTKHTKEKDFAKINMVIDACFSGNFAI